MHAGHGDVLRSQRVDDVPEPFELALRIPMDISLRVRLRGTTPSRQRVDGVTAAWNASTPSRRRLKLKLLHRVPRHVRAQPRELDGRRRRDHGHNIDSLID